jgi:hypothetical protein
MDRIIRIQTDRHLVKYLDNDNLTEIIKYFQMKYRNNHCSNSKIHNYISYQYKIPKSKLRL